MKKCYNLRQSLKWQHTQKCCPLGNFHNAIQFRGRQTYLVILLCFWVWPQQSCLCWTVTLKPDGHKMSSILSLKRSHGLQNSPLCMHQDTFSHLYPSGFCGLGTDWYLQFLLDDTWQSITTLQPARVESLSYFRLDFCSNRQPRSSESLERLER